MAKILIIEDEANLRYTARKSLERSGSVVTECETAEAALQLLEREEPDLILTDVNLGKGKTGIEFIRDVRAGGFDRPILVMTAYGSVDSAVEAMKAGADEYLQKPLSLDELSVVVDRSLKQRQERNRLRLYQRLEQTRDEDRTVLGESEAWKRTRVLAERVAGLPVGSGQQLSAVLLTGETGVGKGVLARFIHDQAAGPDEPFVQVNCSALPATLIESELFGHQKGAFTDARETRQGLFELADGGTIFLDEIGDLPLALQSKLLIVVEQGVFRRIGATKESRVNARIIAATNHDLATAVEEGRFRRDLFYRLNALTIPIPPLRERGDDAILIAEHALAQVGRKMKRPELRLSDEARKAIAEHAWPGNVRELLNSVHRAAYLAPADLVTPQDLGLGATVGTKSDGALKAQRKEGKASSVEELAFDFARGAFSADAVEKHLIVEALRHCRGNVSKAAKLIGMNRSSFRYRIERYDLESLVQELASR